MTRFERISAPTLVIAASIVAVACSGASANEEPRDSWFAAGQARLEAAIAAAGPARARNVILFIGDGMDIPTITAAGILEGQRRGESGEGNLLSFEQFPFLGLAKTYETNAMIADSAGTATAILSGSKTRIGVIGIGEDAIRGNCASAIGEGLPTLVEIAEDAGLATGVVTTTAFTHATPAAAYAHIADREWQVDARIPIDQRALGCEDIASQFLSFDHGDGIEVAMGGGRAYFLPASVLDPEYPEETGARIDGRNLVDEWRAANPGGEFVWNLAGFDEAGAADRLFGLFETDHMKFGVQRPTDAGGEPSLSAMTARAIEILSRDDDGFFLLVEGGRIDHAHHANIAGIALMETIDFADAVRVAAEMTDSSETLIVVTADHGHTMTIAGYAPRGSNILGPASGLARDDMPYTILGYANGSSAAIGTARTDISADDTSAAGYRQQSLVPLFSETHSGEDVPVYSLGPGAQWLSGVMEQNYIFHVIDEVLRARARATD